MPKRKINNPLKNTTVNASFFILFSVVLFTGCAVSNNPQRKEIRQLQKGIIKEDTSFVYQLPFEKDRAHRLVQGYFSRYSHKERAALDFKMKRGTTVCAARAGVVVRVKQDGDKGGWNKKYRPYGNVIVIQHADGSRAGYWHLRFNSALVATGDTVTQGQPIGLSGKTGYTLFPHLHFIAWRFTGNNQWQQVATRFQTSKGIRYLRPLRKYGNK
jgi:murein DD-endopeptidase MepM/ murein hydrolase activator NlpD